MKMKPEYIAFFVIGLFIIFAGIKVNDYLKRDFEKWEREVAAKTDSLKALKEQIEDSEREFEEKEEKWKQQREQDSITIAELTVDVEEAEQDADRREDELRRKLPIKFRAEFEALIASHNRQVAAILSREAEKDRIIERQDARHAQTLADHARINAQLHEALARSEELTQYWKDKAHRSWYEKWQVVAPLTAGATLVGVGVLATVMPD